MKYIAVTIILLFSSIFSICAQQNIDEGKSIFKSRCASCHAIDKRVIGPALKDVDKRRTEEWIIKFVHSPQTLINSGDEEAKKLYQEYNQIIMPDHKDLSEVQIKDIIAYIKGESVKGSAKASNVYVPEYAQPYKDKTSIIDRFVYLNFDKGLIPLNLSDITSWLIIAALIIMLVTLFYLITYLNLFNSYKKKVKEKSSISDVKEEKIEKDIM